MGVPPNGWFIMIYSENPIKLKLRWPITYSDPNLMTYFMIMVYHGL